MAQTLRLLLIAPVQLVRHLVLLPVFALALVLVLVFVFVDTAQMVIKRHPHRMPPLRRALHRCQALNALMRRHLHPVAILEDLLMGLFSPCCVTCGCIAPGGDGKLLEPGRSARAQAERTTEDLEAGGVAKGVGAAVATAATTDAATIDVGLTAAATPSKKLLGAGVLAVEFTRRISLTVRVVRVVTRLQARIRGHLVRCNRASERAAPEGGVLACQAGGHCDTFRCAPDGCLTKETSRRELEVYEALQADALRAFAPRFAGEVQGIAHDHGGVDSGTRWIKLQDLTAGCARPVVMDVKVGTRTFLEAEVRNTKRRPDLAEKMAKQGGALTEEERVGGITKLRYMQFREQSSSSATLGWRIEAIVLPRAAGDGAAAAAAAAAAAEKLDTKKLRERAEIVAAIRTFVAAAPAQRRAPLAAAMRRRLEALRSALEASPFFRAHEVVGSSLLFVHDAADDRADVAAADEGAGVWMIDFAKTAPLAPALVAAGTHTHRAAWEMGNQEDGYLRGIDSLIDVWTEL